MKTLEFIYQETQIHFLLNPDTNVMVNATEMANKFGKKVEAFMRNSNTQAFIKSCLKSENSSFISVESKSDLIDSRQKAGTYMHEILALKFAAWLDPDFEFWVFATIRELTLGNYKRHWDAHRMQEAAKTKEERLRPLILENPTPELVREFLEAQDQQKSAIRMKANAIKNQYKIDFE